MVHVLVDTGGRKEYVHRVSSVSIMIIIHEVIKVKSTLYSIASVVRSYDVASSCFFFPYVSTPNDALDTGLYTELQHYIAARLRQPMLQEVSTKLKHVASRRFADDRRVPFQTQTLAAVTTESMLNAT